MNILDESELGENTGTRKLTAIMFTDLEGYTAMFQRNEAEALHKINIHRRYLDEVTIRHQGSIVQFYGDGSLVVFNSVIDAIKCAIEIQKLSLEHNLPVRAGIHVGDVIFKDEDIFGDSVNVASRIQAIGVPGSVVVSKRIADEMHNHPELGAERLGVYSFKNVIEKIELFALTGPGLVVPPKKVPDSKSSVKTLYSMLALTIIAILFYFFKTYFFQPHHSAIQNERIIILPFKDLTQKSELSLLGELASSIITNDLSETSQADVVSVAASLLYTNADMASMFKNPALARQTGAENMVNGFYSLTGSNQDSLVFGASIINSKNETLAVIPNKTCSTSDPMICIKEMSNAIKGFWKSKDEHLISVPNYNAYVAYLKALKLWAHPDPVVQDQAKSYLLQAIEHDSLFIDAYFLLLDDFSNRNEFENESDTINLIKKRFDFLQPRRENYLRFYEEELYGRNLEAFKCFQKEYVHNPKDLFLNTTGIVMAVEYLNDPNAALRFQQALNMDSMDLMTCTYCRTAVNMALQAFSDLSDTINADKLAKKLKTYADKSSQYTRLIAYYINRGDTANVNDVLKIIAKRSRPGSDDQQFACLMAGRYALLNNKKDLAILYANKAIALYGDTSNRTLGRCHYLKGDFENAEKIFLSELETRPSNTGLYADLGATYARMGNTAKANEIITRLESLKGKYDLGQTTYYQGRIKALLSENAAAIQYLRAALDEGVKFRSGTTFQHDPDLMALHNDKDYQALLTRNRQL